LNCWRRDDLLAAFATLGEYPVSRAVVGRPQCSHGDMCRPFLSAQFLCAAAMHRRAL
jgi:hypothetical protein